MASISEMILAKAREVASGRFATDKEKAALDKIEAEVARLSENKSPADDHMGSRYRIVSDVAALDGMITDLATADALVVKVVATGTDVFKDGLIGVSIARSADYGYFIALRREATPDRLETSVIVSKIQALLETKAIIGHDLKTEYKWFKRLGVTLNVAFDTALAAILIDETKPAGLDDVAQRLLDVADCCPDLETQPANERDVHEIGCHGIRSAIHIFRVYEKLRPIVKAGFDFAFSKVEVPAVPVTAALELAGMPIDIQYVEDAKTKARTQRDALEKKIYEAAGHAFEISSPKQTRTVLFDEMKLPVTRKTKEGDASTSADALEEIDAKANPIVGLILSFRKYETVLKILDSIEADPMTGRVHPSYAQADAVTGRMISSGGAFHAQGVPRDRTLPISIRRAVGNAPGMKIIAADFKADELRLVAAQAREGKLIEAFEAGLNPHGYTAKKIFNLKEEANTIKTKHPDKYTVGKVTNFGIIFGKTVFGLARDLSKELGREVTVDEAEKIIDDYFSEFPAVGAWIETTKQFARDHGFVVDLAGRKRRFVHVHRRSKKGDAEAEQHRERELREAVNFLAQGLAASQVKRAMTRCFSVLQSLSPRTRIVAARHDEFLFETPDEDVDTVCAAIKTAMEDDPELEARGMTVRPEAEVTVGATWAADDQKPWPSASGAETAATVSEKTTKVAGKKKPAAKAARKRKTS